MDDGDCCYCRGVAVQVVVSEHGGGENPNSNIKYGITLIHTELLATICVTVTIFSLFSSSLFLCYHIIIAIILATTGATRAFANIHARLGQTLPLWVRPPRVDRPTGEHS